jgi:hypothetical protein
MVPLDPAKTHGVTDAARWPKSGTHGEAAADDARRACRRAPGS